MSRTPKPTPPLTPSTRNFVNIEDAQTGIPSRSSANNSVGERGAVYVPSYNASGNVSTSIYVDQVSQEKPPTAKPPAQAENRNSMSSARSKSSVASIRAAYQRRVDNEDSGSSSDENSSSGEDEVMQEFTVRLKVLFDTGVIRKMSVKSTSSFEAFRKQLSHKGKPPNRILWKDEDDDDIIVRRLADLHEMFRAYEELANASSKAVLKIYVSHKSGVSKTRSVNSSDGSERSSESESFKMSDDHELPSVIQTSGTVNSGSSSSRSPYSSLDSSQGTGSRGGDDNKSHARGRGRSGGKSPAPPERLSQPKSSNTSTSRGSSIVNYRLGNLLGSGASGRVYMCMDLDHGKFVACKRVEIRDSGMSDSQRQSVLRKIQDEVDLMRELQHENIVQYLGCVTHQSEEMDVIDIFLEYVPGGSLRHILSRFGSFDETIVRAYLRQIMSGLAYLHHHSICHRDIKGGNILVSDRGLVKLADFGASRRMKGLLEQSRYFSIRGTLQWMAPEVVRQTGHSYPSDIWSVGCTVIEMLTGYPPWHEVSNDMAVAFQIGCATEPPSLPADASDACRDFLAKCLIINPKDRWTATELLNHPFLNPTTQFIRKQPQPSRAADIVSEMKSARLQQGEADWTEEVKKDDADVVAEQIGEVQLENPTVEDAVEALVESGVVDIDPSSVDTDGNGADIE